MLLSRLTCLHCSIFAPRPLALSVSSSVKSLSAVLSVSALLGCGGGGGGEPATGAPTSPGTSVSVPRATSATAPVAGAGRLQNVLVGTTVSVDGSSSTDADGDALSYRWTLTSKPTGSAASLSAPGAVRATFVADVQGIYTAALVVNDGGMDSTSASVTITAAQGNAAPVANSGPPQNVTRGTVVTLSGAGSSDANGDSLTYQWTVIAKPNGSAASLTRATSALSTFTADLAGTYIASLVVNDGRVSSVADTVTVTANEGNVAPVAAAGPAQSVVAGSTVALNGGASTDANGDNLTYAWTLTSRPAGSGALLSSTTSPQPTFASDVAGTFVATLVVSDGRLTSQPSTVSVTVAAANALPIANAGTAQAVGLASSVTVDGTASGDADGDALTYAWSFQSFPGFFAPALLPANSATPRFTPRDAGVYVLSLTVSDGRATSAPSTVTVTVDNSVAPTATGSGLVVQTVANFKTFDEPTLTLKVDFSCGTFFYAIDRRPDGVVVGMTGFQYFEIQPVTGICLAKGPTPESIRALAVSPQGQTFGMSESQYTSPAGTQAHRLHKLSSSGASQSFIFLSGSTRYVNAIDFGPDGELYGFGITPGGVGWSIVRIDPETGVTTTVAALPVAPTLGDIDIDATGVLRTVIDGSLYKFSIYSGALLSATQMPGFPLGYAFTPVVYVP